MRLGLVKEHHDFFHRHRHIEFEGLLTLEEVFALKGAMKEVFVKRLDKRSLKNVPDKTLYEGGRDGWRDHPVIKKVVLRSTLAEVAATLSKVFPLRIGFDQMLYDLKEEKTFLPLQEMSSIQKVACGLYLDLAEKEGSGIFFAPDFPLSLNPGASGILITYVEEKALYIYEKRDPHNHALKRLDYVFGDRLRSETHPFVFKP